MILEAITNPFSKIYKLTFCMRSSYSVVKDRYSCCSFTLAFPLKTPEKLHTLEAALKERKARGQFVSCEL